MTSPEHPLPIVVGISGSSGALLGRRAVEILVELGYRVHLTYTDACKQVWPEEVGIPFMDDLKRWTGELGVKAFKPEDFRAPMSSGSFPTMGMIVIPCSMRTVSSIARAGSSNLLERAADVTIKEGRRLVLIPRETPLSVLHLENMLTLARLGVRIVPPIPQYYLRLNTMEEVIDTLVRRCLTALDIQEALPTSRRWRAEDV